MLSLLYITLVATLLVGCAAAPTAAQGFTIPQVAVKLDWRPNGVQRTAQMYRKFRASMPEEVAAAAATQTGTVVASPSDQYDDEYTCPVTIGGQTLTLDFDTGSSDLWAFSSLTPESERHGHNIYTPTDQAHRLKGYTWDISYGDGSGASGVVFTDQVVIGGASVTSQAVEAATSVSAEFVSDTASDGLLGLAFSSINTVKPQSQNTWFQNVLPSLPKPLFTADLKHQNPGTYNFGFIDSDKHTGPITYTNVNTANGFWQFTGSGYAVGSSNFVSQSINTIADTGTTLVYLPPAIVKSYWKQVKGAQNSNLYGGYVFPCSASLPSLTIGIGSHHAVIPGKYINYSPVQSGSSTCYGGVQPNTGIGFSILGDVFLKSQFVVFNGGSIPKLGFANKPLS